MQQSHQLKTAGIEVGQKASMAGTAAIGIGVMAVAASKNREK